MSHRLASLALLAAAVSSQAAPRPQQTETATKDIPSRPELLRFADDDYRPPRGEDYRHRLSNGIPVYVVEDRAVPLVDVSVALSVGGYLDPAEGLGAASLTALLLRRGGSQRLSAAELDRVADDLAIRFNSLGGGDRSGVTLSCSPAVLDRALQLMIDVLRRPRFEEERVAQARSNLRSSLAVRRGDPSRMLRISWNRLHYGARHYLARQMTEEHLDRLDAAALRRFHRRHWRPERTVVAVAGDVDARSVVEQLEQLLGDWQSEDSPGERRRPLTPAKGSPPGIYLLDVELAQGQLLMGHRALLRQSWDDPELFAVMVMSEILGGGGAVSRLSSRLRHRESLVYQVRASVGIGLHQPGLLEVAAGVSPRHAVSVAQMVIEEMKKMTAAPPPPTELELAKKALVDALPLLFDGAEQRAGIFAEDALLGRPHSYWRTYRQRVEGVSAAAVHRAARRNLRPSELRILWVGAPLPEADWASLGLGAPRALSPGG